MLESRVQESDQLASSAAHNLGLWTDGFRHVGLNNTMPYQQQKIYTISASNISGVQGGQTTDVTWIPNVDQKNKVQAMHLQFDLTNNAANSIILSDPWLLIDSIAISINDGKVGDDDSGYSGIDLALLKQLRMIRNEEREYETKWIQALKTVTTTGTTAPEAGLTIATGTTSRISLDLFDAFPFLIDWVTNQFTGPKSSITGWNINKIKFQFRFISSSLAVADATRLYRSSTDANSLLGATYNNLSLVMRTTVMSPYNSVLASPLGMQFYVPKPRYVSYEKNMATAAQSQVIRLADFTARGELYSTMTVYVSTSQNTAWNAANATRYYSGPKYLKWRFQIDNMPDTLIDTTPGTGNADLIMTTVNTFESMTGQLYPLNKMYSTDYSNYLLGRVGTLINIAGIEQKAHVITHAGIPYDNQNNSSHMFSVTVSPVADGLMSATCRIDAVLISDRVALYAPGNSGGDGRYVNAAINRPPNAPPPTASNRIPTMTGSGYAGLLP